MRTTRAVRVGAVGLLLVGLAGCEGLDRPDRPDRAPAPGGDAEASGGEGRAAGDVARAAGDAGGDPLLAPGVSAELAAHRRAVVSEPRYVLEFRVPAAVEEPVEGRARIVFRLSSTERSLPLDFAGGAADVSRLTVNGEAVPVEAVNGHLVLPAASLREGENAVEAEFVAGDGPLNRNEEYLYTLFVPDRAHEAFPCFDQPDLKGRFTLALRVPEGWRAVANGAELAGDGGAVSGPGGASGEGDPAGAGPPAGSPPPPGTLPAREALGADEDAANLHRFAETEPLPTYLFAFAAGRFRVEEAERAGRRVRLFHRETDAGKVARNVEPVFDLHGRALEWLEEYTGIPYPFGKFDFVLVPSFQYNGMEHPGAILYRAESLLLDESATKTDELRRASVIAHETAHMWFGDLVTMEWFDDVWMKEVFANFMAAKIVNPSFPEIDHDLRFLLAHHPGAYAVDRTEGANPIRQELENLDEAGALYGAIIYQKAPIVMRQLELLTGEDGMRAGLREYLDANRFANASWPDLIRTLDARHEEDLAGWSRVWVEEPGRPWVEADLSGSTADAGDASERFEITVRQRDPRERGLLWNQRVELRVGFPEAAVSVGLRLDEEAVEAEVPAERADSPAASDPAAVSDPRWILPGAAGLGYGYFRLSDATRRSLVDEAGLLAVEPAVARAAAWLSLWDEMLEGRVAPEPLARLALRMVEEEREELVVEQVLEDLRTLFWRFLDANGRGRIAAPLEALLWERMHAAESSSLRATYYRGLESMAVTGNGVDRLVRLWRGDLRVPGLELSERDLTRLSLELVVRRATGWRGALDRQARRIDNPDRRERFAFVRPAVSAEPAVRDSFFRALADPANRSHEPWVLEGVSYLHHPLRAAEAVPYIRPSLEMLEEIRRTGDIFFPERWLDATLGGHSSPEAAAVVRGFLEERPDLPSRLREKVLQSADVLFRVVASPRTSAPD